MEAEGSTNGAGTTENTAHIHSATGVRHAPPLQPRRLLTSIYAGAFSSPAPEERGWLLTGGGETLCTDGYCHYLPAVVHKMDPGILAQQSDVRCKRGRLGVIMIAPAAHTSKGLAKAFVSSAGGKGPETFRGALRPLFLAPSEEPARQVNSTRT